MNFVNYECGFFVLMIDDGGLKTFVISKNI
jgi:hypothetical protein